MKYEVQRTKDKVRTSNPARIAVACLFVLVLGCDEGIEKYTPEPNVYCIIEAGRDTVSLMAGMTLSYSDSVPDSNRWNGTAGVVAKVQHQGAEAVFTELPGPVGFYRAEPVSVVPGDTYDLMATYPDGRVVRGSTTVPDTFSLHSLRLDTVFYVPWPGETLRMFRYSFAWSESRGAKAYFEASVVWYKSGSDSLSTSCGSYPTRGLYDTLSVEPFAYIWDTLRQTMDSLPLDRVRLAIRAADRNYYDYFMLGYEQNVRESMHLDGAVGVFGSACIAETTFRFQPGR
jgi:hypothetical protein